MGNIGHREKTHSESQERDEEEFQINVIGQILIKIKENSKQRKDIPIQTQLAHRTPWRQERKETLHSISWLKH